MVFSNLRICWSSIVLGVIGAKNTIIFPIKFGPDFSLIQRSILPWHIFMVQPVYPLPLKYQIRFSAGAVFS